MKKINIIFLAKASDFPEDFLEGLRNALGNNVFTKTAFTSGVPIMQFKPLPKTGHSRFIQKIFYTKHKPLIIIYPKKPEQEVLWLMQRSNSIRQSFFSLSPPLPGTLNRKIFSYKEYGRTNSCLLRI